MKNWTWYFRNCKELVEKGYKLPYPSYTNVPNPELKKARNELARYILDNMKGGKDE